MCSVFFFQAEDGIRDAHYDLEFRRVLFQSAEAHIDSSFDGMFNFLLGGIYLDEKVRDNSYYVNSFGLDYAAGILPALARAGGAIPAALPPILFGSPFYRNDEATFRLKSYGIFG